MTVTCDVAQLAHPGKRISAGQGVVYVSEADSHLTYMIDIALTTEFAITAGNAE